MNEQNKLLKMIQNYSFMTKKDLMLRKCLNIYLIGEMLKCLESKFLLKKRNYTV